MGRYLLAGSLCWLMATAIYGLLPGVSYPDSITAIGTGLGKSKRVGWLELHGLITIGMALSTSGLFQVANWFLPTKGRLFTNVAFLSSVFALAWWLILVTLLIFTPEPMLPNQGVLQETGLMSFSRIWITSSILFTYFLVSIAFLRVNAPRLLSLSLLLTSLTVGILFLLHKIHFYPLLCCIPLLMGIYFQTPRAAADGAY